MTRTFSFTRSNAPSSLGAAETKAGANVRLFSSSRFTMSNAVQGKLVNVGTVCMSSPFHAHEYGARDEGRIRKHDGE
jgi:hypothetical protein